MYNKVDRHVTNKLITMEYMIRTLETMRDYYTPGSECWTNIDMAIHYINYLDDSLNTLNNILGTNIREKNIYYNRREDTKQT